MRALVTRPSGLFSLCSYFTFLLLLHLLASAADQTAGKSARKPTKAKSTNATPAAAPTPAIVTEDAALASFDAFTIEWMKKLAQTEEFHRTQLIKISESPEGISAEYTGYLPHRYIIVKKTNSKETPFVGVLTYFEKTLRCVGKTREEALKGPFDQVETSPVSEIFPFTKGKWEY